MTHMNFRLVILPKSNEDPDIDLLKHYVEQCDIVVHSINRIELQKEKGINEPEIFEYIYNVVAEDQFTISNKKKVDVYRDFYRKWHRLTENIEIGKRPLLQPHLDECYLGIRFKNYEPIPLISISFGCMPRFGEFLEYATVESQNPNVCFSHDLRELDVNISTKADILSIEYIYFTLSYKSLRNIFISLCDTHFDLYLDVSTCPLFFRKSIDDILTLRTKVTRILPEGIDIMIAGKSNVIRLRFTNSNQAFENISCLRNRAHKIPVNFVAVTTRSKTLPVCPEARFAHFGCCYMYNAIINRCFTFVEQSENIQRDLIKLLRYSQESPSSLEKALTDTTFIIDSGRLVNYWDVLDKLYVAYSTKLKNKEQGSLCIPAKCRLIRRITITPTRILMWPPDLMTENRVLRNFDSEFLIRATFRDDNFSTLNGMYFHPNVFHQVVSIPMNKGITIGGRHYELLAWSSSQLKEHGVSMYAKDTRNRTAIDIRRWTEIDPRTNMNIPKCLARIGQCFSQTEDTVNVPLDAMHVRIENDIVGGYSPLTLEPYTFSDGVGKISKALAKQVSSSLRNAATCSAFQVRYSGCKGMLVVDPSLRNADIVFRKSMKKFECRGSSHTKLEIANKSAPITMRLNRPFITILHDLKIDPRVFLRLQEDMLQSLTDMLMDEEKASDYLNSRTPFSNYKFKDLNRSGISLIMEPFFRNLLLALHRYYIDIIKSRANIDLDPGQARNMFGVMDETGILEYGQVFVQYSRDASLGVSTPEDTVVLKGTVMVTKFPCVHPGDVRKFTAVDVPKLHHIVDCIVFPRKGPRPHPDEMAGSDLDGDQYAVIWMKELIFEGENKSPTHYPKPVGNQFENVSDFLSTSKTEDVADFLVHYIKNDQIGAIASAHLAVADQFSIFHTQALKIADKHAIAVDFSKTGVSSRLEPNEHPKECPDFMEKMWKRKYKSKKSLGKMYRVSKDFESENRSSILHYKNVQLDEALVVEGWEKFEESAIASRNEYNSTLKTVLQTYGIEHEAEAFGGAFIKLHSRFLDRRDRQQIVELIYSWLKMLLDNTRNKFLGNPKSGDIGEVNLDIQRKASAWYIVTYREKSSEYLSFPWVVSDILSNIRLLKLNSIPPLFPVSLESKLDISILENASKSFLSDLPSEAAHLLRPLRFNCDKQIVERAVRVLSKWAEEERITTTTRDGSKKLLYYNTFVKLIIYVAEEEGYIANKKRKVKEYPSSAGLCLSFFKFCVKLRFASKEEIATLLPFPVYKLNFLAKMAITAFHSIAVSGAFQTLCNQEYMTPVPELVDMREITIDSSVFGRYPVDKNKLKRAEDRMKQHSEVQYVSLREHVQKRKVIATARGTTFALKRLKEILKKDAASMETFILLGED